jgi:hypothetical protein
MSWYQLLAIKQEADETARMYARMPPSACPHDGEPLEPGIEPGTLHCRFDGYLWPRDGRRI